MGNQKAIITGGSKGIGSGIVRKLASLHYDIMFSYGRHEEEAQALCRDMQQQYGISCCCLQAALEMPGNGKVFFSQAVAALGGCDLLVNNAGVTIMQSIFDLTEEKMDYMINLNFRNYLILMREAVCYMAKHGIRGSVVNITSSRGQRAYPADAIYGGIKAGLNRAIESIALDVAPYGIRVNNVAPGAIRIRSKEEILKEFGPGVPVEFWDALGERIPLERSGTPEDIANAVAFLASEAASYITGVTLRVDGGLILPGMPEVISEDTASHGWGYVKKINEE